LRLNNLVAHLKIKGEVPILKETRDYK
jgi:hypothetical protein